MLNGTLTDKIANSPDEREGTIFAEGLERITDIEVGPDGYLYLLSFGNGEIYRIVPK